VIQVGKARVIDVKQAGAQFETLVKDAAHHRAHWIVQEDGVSLAVIVSIDDYEDMLETFGELADPGYLASIREARNQYQTGEVDSLQDLRDIIETEEATRHTDEKRACHGWGGLYRL
jgi:PHD/YefM family antitoxin component YafN of YafNO toxin-antitoxin module